MSLHNTKLIEISSLEADWLNWLAGWVRLDPSLAKTKKEGVIDVLESIVKKYDKAED